MYCNYDLGVNVQVSFSEVVVITVRCKFGRVFQSMEVGSEKYPDISLSSTVNTAETSPVVNIRVAVAPWIKVRLVMSFVMVIASHLVGFPKP